MDPVIALYGSIALIAVHALLVAVLSRYVSDSAGTTTATPGPEPEAAIDRESETVTCPTCGTENDLGYEYCAGCIEELPGTVQRTTSSVAPGRRGIF
ncbi:DUF7577 domain-containing protein [Natrinema amylolyticum]|uniref:DUF7577 domain-containing protein n=1 Tax=Natrinema amylolyticum TaxID=2878679 RepID=UPI001CFB511E|nr:hypothetical protein [Natrinema amylolyticum]